MCSVFAITRIKWTGALAIKVLYNAHSLFIFAHCTFFNFEEYAALLTGRFRQQAVLTEGVGRAYVTLHEGNVHYSIYHEHLEEPPTGIKFLDVKHTILHEQEKEYSNDGKVLIATNALYFKPERKYFSDLWRVVRGSWLLH
jgi:hypothetical protein